MAIIISYAKISLTKKSQNKKLLISLLILPLLVLQSCSLTKGSSINISNANKANLVPPGFLVMNRPAPKVEVATKNDFNSSTNVSNGETVFGFTPIKESFKPEKNERVLTAEIKDMKLNVTSYIVNSSGEDKKSSSFEIKSTKDLPAGTYKVLLIQENPTWYADDSYFAKRELSVPKPNSKERFLKGVLGKKAIYLSKDITIHSSKYLIEDANGMSLSSSDIDELTKFVKVNDTIVVK